MEKLYYVTITGISHYYGKKPFEINQIIKLIKEPDNQYDDEAILAFLPYIEKVGYVANSTNTVYGGTISAGRLYDKIDDYAYARVMFVTHSSVIALVLDKDEVENNGGNKGENLTDAEIKEKTEKSSEKKGTIGFKAE